MKLRIGIGLAIVIVLGFWVSSRWQTWFVEEDEEAYVPSLTPSHVLLTFGDTHPLSRNVSWQADSVVRPSWLELVCLADSDTIRVEAQGEVFRSRGGQAAYYVARLRSLQACTSYAYRAVTRPLRQVVFIRRSVYQATPSHWLPMRFTIIHSATLCRS